MAVERGLKVARQSGHLKTSDSGLDVRPLFIINFRNDYSRTLWIRSEFIIGRCPPLSSVVITLRRKLSSRPCISCRHDITVTLTTCSPASGLSRRVAFAVRINALHSAYQEKRTKR